MKRKFVLSILISLLGICFSGCEKQPMDPKPQDHFLEIFDSAWNRVEDVYPFFEFKGIDWDAVYTEYRPRFESSEGGEEFATAFFELLAELKDGHVWFQSILGNHVIPWPTPRQIRDKNSFSLELVESYFTGDLRATASGSMHYEILPDDIGYVAVTDFNHEDFNDEWSDVLEYLRNTNGLIVDNRPNTGGNTDNIKALVTRFITSSMAWPNLYFLGELCPLPNLQPAGPMAYTKPVVVLINGCTFSAGEVSTEILRQLSNVTVIGDTTGGGAGAGSHHSKQTVSRYSLPYGIIINIPTGCFKRYDGEEIEWLGVPPDIRVEQTSADIQSGIDRQLEYAIELLK